MRHFQLVTTVGDVLGARELGRPDWPPGSVIYIHGASLRGSEFGEFGTHPPTR